MLLFKWNILFGSEFVIAHLEHLNYLHWKMFHYVKILDIL
jgi:hypothetical protein